MNLISDPLLAWVRNPPKHPPEPAFKERNIKVSLALGVSCCLNSSPDSPQDEHAVCNGAKGVLAVTVIAMFCATMGLVCAFACSWPRRPYLAVIPHIFCSTCLIISVVTYGANTLTRKSHRHLSHSHKQQPAEDSPSQLVGPLLSACPAETPAKSFG